LKAQPNEAVSSGTVRTRSDGMSRRHGTVHVPRGGDGNGLAAFPAALAFARLLRLDG
jgi:hypothetical protein